MKKLISALFTLALICAVSVSAQAQDALTPAQALEIAKKANQGQDVQVNGQAASVNSLMQAIQRSGPSQSVDVKNAAGDVVGTITKGRGGKVRFRKAGDEDAGKKGKKGK